MDSKAIHRRILTELSGCDWATSGELACMVGCGFVEARAMLEGMVVEGTVNRRRTRGGTVAWSLEGKGAAIEGEPHPDRCEVCGAWLDDCEGLNDYGCGASPRRARA